MLPPPVVGRVGGGDDVEVRAVVREVGLPQVGGRQDLVVGDDAADGHDIVEDGLEVLVEGELVCAGVDGEDVVACGVIERLPCHGGGRSSAESHVNDLVAVVGGPDSAGAGSLRACDEGAVDAHVGERAEGADAGDAGAVVGLSGDEAVAAGAVAVAVGAELVAVAVAGVPAGDVVDEAVGVAV